MYAHTDRHTPSFSLSLKHVPTGAGWFDIEDAQNHNVYISGLPHDITQEEFAELMSKYGIIMEDDDGGCGLERALQLLS